MKMLKHYYWNCGLTIIMFEINILLLDEFISINSLKSKQTNFKNVEIIMKYIYKVVVLHPYSRLAEVVLHGYVLLDLEE